MAKPAKIELPADLGQPWVAPEDATVADLTTMAEQVKADAQKLLTDGATAEDVAKAEWLIAARKAMQGRQDELVAADDAAKERLAAVRAQLDDAQAEGEGGEGGEETDEQKAEREKAEADAAAAAAAAGTSATAPPAPAEPVLVASSAAVQRSAIADARRGGGNSDLPARATKPREAYLTAAAEVQGFQAGQRIDFGGLGKAAEQRFRQLPNPTQGNAGRTVLPIGQVNVPSDDQLVASMARGGGEFTNIDAAIEWALSPERLKRETGEESLQAAGGWCAPSETMYDLINLTTTDGMVDVPGITVNRGGLRYSLGPDFTAVYNAGANFTRTEAQTIAALAKPIVNIPCPTFTDNRMVVDGLYLTGDILSQRGYPEAYTDFQQKALTAFAHYVNAQTIADMVALSGTVIDLTVSSAGVQQPNLAVSTEVLGAVELQIMDMRYKNRLSISNAVEVIFPLWLKGAIRSDLAKRQAVEDAAKISDADINDYFALRGATIQWVYDWQDAFTGVSGGFGSATAPVVWPTSALFMVHPQGTFVRALSDVIELNAVYDAQLLTTNQYVALFMEQARLTLKRSWDARICKVPVLVTGATGAPIDYTVAGRQPTV